jgi:hypothetical protein
MSLVSWKGISYLTRDAGRLSRVRDPSAHVTGDESLVPGHLASRESASCISNYRSHLAPERLSRWRLVR